MAGIFDGLASVIDGVVGADINWTPDGGSATTLRGIFRQNPVAIASDDGGETPETQPTVEIRQPEADAIARGDTIAPGDGHTYTVLASQPHRSPASDAFLTFYLERTE